MRDAIVAVLAAVSDEDRRASTHSVLAQLDAAENISSLLVLLEDGMVEVRQLSCILLRRALAIHWSGIAGTLLGGRVRDTIVRVLVADPSLRRLVIGAIEQVVQAGAWPGLLEAAVAALDGEGEIGLCVIAALIPGMDEETFDDVWSMLREVVLRGLVPGSPLVAAASLVVEALAAFSPSPRGYGEVVSQALAAFDGSEEAILAAEALAASDVFAGAVAEAMLARAVSTPEAFFPLALLSWSDEYSPAIVQAALRFFESCEEDDVGAPFAALESVIGQVPSDDVLEQFAGGLGGFTPFAGLILIEALVWQKEVFVFDRLPVFVSFVARDYADARTQAQALDCIVALARSLRGGLSGQCSAVLEYVLAALAKGSQVERVVGGALMAANAVVSETECSFEALMQWVEAALALLDTPYRDTAEALLTACVTALDEDAAVLDERVVRALPAEAFARLVVVTGVTDAAVAAVIRAGDLRAITVLLEAAGSEPLLAAALAGLGDVSDGPALHAVRAVARVSPASAMGYLPQVVHLFSSEDYQALAYAVAAAVVVASQGDGRELAQRLVAEVSGDAAADALAALRQLLPLLDDDARAGLCRELLRCVEPTDPVTCGGLAKVLVSGLPPAEFVAWTRRLARDVRVAAAVPLARLIGVAPEALPALRGLPRAPETTRAVAVAVRACPGCAGEFDLRALLALGGPEAAALAWALFEAVEGFPVTPLLGLALCELRLMRKGDAGLAVAGTLRLLRTMGWELLDDWGEAIARNLAAAVAAKKRDAARFGITADLRAATVQALRAVFAQRPQLRAAHGLNPAAELRLRAGLTIR